MDMFLSFHFPYTVSQYDDFILKYHFTFAQIRPIRTFIWPGKRFAISDHELILSTSLTGECLGSQPALIQMRRRL